MLKNYKIINSDSHSNVCYLFFSSTGIVNSTRSKEWVIEHDYYEFINVAQSKRFLDRASKMVFLRDLTGNFYINGINSDIDSVDKIISFLRNETVGYDVIAVGVSGGGYLAMISAALLPNVVRVYMFGALFNIGSWKGSHLQYSFADTDVFKMNLSIPEKAKYFNLFLMLKNFSRSNLDIYYFYGNKSECDLGLVSEIKENGMAKIVSFVGVDTAKHGGELSYYDYVSLLSKSPYKKLLFKECYSKLCLSIKLQGLFGYITNRIKNAYWRFLNK